MDSRGRPSTGLAVLRQSKGSGGPTSPGGRDELVGAVGVSSFEIDLAWIRAGLYVPGTVRTLCADKELHSLL